MLRQPAFRANTLNGEGMRVRFRTVSIHFVCSLSIAALFFAEDGKSSRDVNWPDYGGGPASMQFSPLAQIDKSNVANLTQAWFYPVPDEVARFNFNPVIVNGVMYVLGDNGAIVALDAATGKTLWTHPSGADLMDRGIN